MSSEIISLFLLCLSPFIMSILCQTGGFYEKVFFTYGFNVRSSMVDLKSFK